MQVTDETKACQFSIGDRVRKTKGSWWEGKVVGFYSTDDNPAGVAVQLDMVPNGPVQIYPAVALTAALSKAEPVGVGVKVKPLEWMKNTYGPTGELVSLTADLPGRESAYKIEPVTANTNFRLFIEGRERKHSEITYWPLAEAKAAAQSDYEQRILSALSLPCKENGETVTPSSETAVVALSATTELVSNRDELEALREEEQELVVCQYALAAVIGAYDREHGDDWLDKLDEAISLARTQKIPPSSGMAGLTDLIKRIADTPIWRDTYPDGPDMMDGDYRITPADVRACRAAATEADHG